MRNDDRWMTLKIASTFLGTIIGAGFASGQEILKFFTVYRFDGYLGIIAATLLFVVLGGIISNLAFIIKRKSYHDFLIYVCGRKLGIFVDVLITVFLFGTLNVMLSATGALFSEHFGLPYYFGVILTAVISAVVVIRGIKSILNVNLVIAPLMIGIVVVVAGLCLHYHADSDLIRNLHYEDDSTYKWLFSALLYVSYNIILSTPILIPLGKETQSKKALVRGIVGGSIIMGLLILLLNTVILNHIEQVSIYQIPMLYIIEPFNNVIKYLFILVLWFEIFTTILANLFGLSGRIQAATNLSHTKVVVLICTVSIFISRLDFKTLLSILYPTFGFISLIFILFLVIKQIYVKIRSVERKIAGSQSKKSANY